MKHALGLLLPSWTAYSSIAGLSPPPPPSSMLLVLMLVSIYTPDNLVPRAFYFFFEGKALGTRLMHLSEGRQSGVKFLL